MMQERPDCLPWDSGARGPTQGLIRPEPRLLTSAALETGHSCFRLPDHFAVPIRGPKAQLAPPCQVTPSQFACNQIP